MRNANRLAPADADNRAQIKGAPVEFHIVRSWEVTAVITFEGVSKHYLDGTVAVDDLNLTLPTGKVTAFVGPSGCGKTTTLRMINRMIDPSEGVISIDGDDISGQNAAHLRRKIGYVIQSAGLFPHRTIIDNIATVPILDGVKKRKARAIAAELMERVGLDKSMAKRYPNQLSGGQQQRVGVARALAADPPVLLMDEPFSALDPVVREGLQQEFLRLQQDLGKTIAFVTHDIDEATTMGDQIAIFQEGGKVAQVGSPQQLLEQPANDFVAEFVGRDRGWRSLGFEPASALPITPLTGPSPTGAATFGPTDTIRQATDAAICSPGGTAVMVDDAGQPVGAVSLRDIARHIHG